MAGKIVIIFDFDRTLIDDDSDSWIITNMGLTHLFNQLRSTLPWNSLMDRMLEELHSQGKMISDIAECLKRIPLHPQIISAIKSAHANGCELKVVSDSNEFYIKTILEQYGVYNLFSEIITNPAVVDSEGRLRILPYQPLGSSHGCNLCPGNLCKGNVIKKIQALLPEYGERSIVYVGDGRNDFCPCLKLGPGDYVMPRKGYPLWNMIFRDRVAVSAGDCPWKDGEELATLLLELIGTIYNEDKKSLKTNQVNMFESNKMPASPTNH